MPNNTNRKNNENNLSWYNANLFRGNNNNSLPDPNDTDAFVSSILRGDVGMVGYYLNESDDVSDVDNEGYTPLTALLYKASRMPQDQMPWETQDAMLDLFIQVGVDLDMPDAHETLPTFYALSADFPVAQKLYSHADIQQTRFEDHVNLLMAAAGLGLEELIVYLYPQFDPNSKDDNGATIFHHAVLADRTTFTRMEQLHPANVIEVLCGLGADHTLEDNFGNTPLDLAYSLRRYDIALALKRCGRPPSDSRKIKIQFGDTEEPQPFYVYLSDTVEDVKKALLFDKYRDFHFYFPRFYKPEARIMENDRAFSDYDIRQDDLIKIMPKLKAGLKGGNSRRAKRSKRKSTRRR